jgi:hypothetical protein
MPAAQAGREQSAAAGKAARQRAPLAIAAYLGGSGKFEQAVADFGATYADQTVRDHAALAEAVASGRAQATPGV